MNRRGRFAFALALACALGLTAAPGALAGTFTVTNTHDSGTASLRDAIEQANDEVTNPGEDTIQITGTGSIGLESALPDLSTPMSIVGPGASSLTVTRAFGASNFRIFAVDSATVAISRLSVKKGVAEVPSPVGGGIANFDGTLTLKSVVVAKNSAFTTDSNNNAQGGGVASTGPLTVKTSRITGNHVGGNTGGWGGSGIMSQGTLDLERSTVDGNTRDPGGFSVVGDAAVDSYGGTIENSTIAKNDGIGLSIAVSTTTVRSSTIARNAGDADTSVANVRVVGPAGTASFQNTIVAEPPPSGSNCESVFTPTFISQGHNLSSDGSCDFGGPGDRKNKNPKLGSLGMNGGPTPTMAIPKSSPATDRGDSFGVVTDQRGKKRPRDFAAIPNSTTGDGADIGAFEVQ